MPPSIRFSATPLRGQDKGTLSPLALVLAALVAFCHWFSYSTMVAQAFGSSRSAVLVTGATDGIGGTTAKHMAALGYDVLIHGRDARRIEATVEKVQNWVSHHCDCSKKKNQPDDPGPRTIYPLLPADLSTVQGSRQLAAEVNKICEREPNLRLTVLLNNAGVYSERHVVTADGLEQTFAVNVVAPFVLTSLLLPTLLQHPGSRIVIASSISQCRSIRDWDDLPYYQRRTFSAHGSYAESKLCDAMLSMEMADRFTKAGLGVERITCNCLDPGTVNTKMLLAGWGPCGIDVEDALDQTWLCSSATPPVAKVTGRYFVHQSDRRAASPAYDARERTQLWSILTRIAPDAAAMWDFDWL